MAKTPIINALALHGAAHAAGMAAGNAHVPTPMYVSGGTSGTVYHVPSGVCGFAWVKFPGNTSFGRAMKKAGLARSAYGGGLDVWASGFDQSMECKEAYARAYANVLRTHGIDAYAQSRMD